MIEQLEGKFVKVRCKCKNEQVIFERAATKVHCLVCGELLATPKGGKADFVARALEVLK